MGVRNVGGGGSGVSAFASLLSNTATPAGSTVTPVSGDNIYMIRCRTGIGVCTVNLPDRAGPPTGRFFIVYDTDGNASVNNIVLQPQAGQSIDGGGAGAPLNLVNNGEGRFIWHDQTNNIWRTLRFV